MSVPAETNVSHEYITAADFKQICDYWASCCPPRDADPDFTLFLIRTRPQAERLHALAIRAAGEPKALLVGRVERMRVPIKLGGFRLPTPELKVLTVPYGGWLGEINEERAALFVDALLRSLSKREFDAVELHWASLSSNLMQAALARPAFLCRDRSIAVETHRVLDLPAEGKGFLGSLSSNERYQQRKRERRLNENFSDVRVEAFSSLGDTGMLMQQAEAVAHKSYQRGIGVGFFMNDEVRSRLEFYADAGWLRGFILFLDHKPCAFWIGTLRHGTFTSDYLAFDPAYAKHTPGMYLILQVIEALMKEAGAPARRIDFGGGDADYKMRLSNLSLDEARVFIFGPTLRPVGVNILRATLGRINPFLKKLLEEQGLLTKVKRIWRARLTKRQD